MSILYFEFLVNSLANQVIESLTGYDEKRIEDIIYETINLKEFFEQSTLNSSAYLIKGVAIMSKTLNHCFL